MPNHDTDTSRGALNSARRRLQQIFRFPIDEQGNVKIGPLDANGELVTATPMTTEELLTSILTEMRVQSIYLHQLPRVLNEGTNFGVGDDPAKLREALANGK